MPPEVTNTTRPASADSAGSSSSVISTGPSTCSAIVSSWPCADVVRVCGRAPALCTRARSGSPDARKAAQKARTEARSDDVAAPDPGRTLPPHGGLDLGGDPAPTSGVAHHEVHGGPERREVEGGAPAQAGRRPGDGDVPPGQHAGARVGRPGRQATAHGVPDPGEPGHDGAVEEGVQRPGGAVGGTTHIRARIAAVAPRR